MGLAKSEETFDSSSENAEPITSEHIAAASEDTFINRTALNPNQHADVFGAITSYVAGSPVIVEYFKLHAAYINKATVTSSFSLERAASRYSYDLIHNFEFKLIDQLEIVIDPDTTETTITGEGITYSGFRANVGDLFLFKLPDDQIGVFIVNEATPLSIYRNTNYKISFNLYAFITEDIITKLNEAVSEELYFDKQKFFSDDVALLTSTSYSQLEELKEFQKDILQRTFSYFYDSEEKTLLRKDRIYDPFLTGFWQAITSIKDYSSSTPLCQISTLYNQLFTGSIFNAFLLKDLNQLDRMIQIPCKYQTHLWDSNYSSLDKFIITILLQNQDGKLDGRLTPTSFIRELDGVSKEQISYVFSNRLYRSLIHRYETGDDIVDVDTLEVLYQDDTRFAPELSEEGFAFNHNDYLPLADFSFEDITNTQSNNNIHMPDGEYMIYEWLVYNRVDVEYLLNTIRPLFPFTKMSDTDKFYYYAVVYYLTKVAISRLR